MLKNIQFTHSTINSIMQRKTQHYINVDSLPDINPLAEEKLMLCLKKEVELYTANINGTKCQLCPFRTFSKLTYLKDHLKYHCSKNMYIADVRSKQRLVLRAYYDYCHAVDPIVSKEKFNLLQYSASVISKWNLMCSDSVLAILKKQNRPILVRVLTHTGPQYWVKELTKSCIRHSREIYYTPRFADLFLSMLMVNEGRISTSLNALYLHYGSTSMCPGLLPSDRVFWNDLVQNIISHPIFKSKIYTLKHKAAAAGEFEVISHDETFKSLFSIIGQEKMSQRSGELHALHTFRGFTGCVIGVSAQRSTSAFCFTAAVSACFDDKLTTQVKFLYSDSPLRINKAAKSVFPSLLAIGEDPIHLPIRLEYCWGEFVNKPSARVRQLHRKFCVPLPTYEQFWQPEDDNNKSVLWPTDSVADSRSSAQWKLFCTLPFSGNNAYLDYVI